MSIFFKSADVKAPQFSRKRTKETLNQISLDNSYNIKRLDYIFCSDDYLLNINQKFLKHNTLTDIITFGYAEKPIVLGEIFISVNRIKDNSLRYNIPFQKELFRVIFHGLLHLCGYDDKTKRDKAIMRQKEEFYLELIEK